MRLVIIFLLASMAVGLAPATPFPEAIEKALGGTKPDAMMSTWLDRLSFENLAKRKERYEAVKTAEDIQAWQKSQYDYFVSALGGFPERTPLNPQVVGGGEGEGYRYEKIIFESRPQFFVPGILYFPVTSGPWPAVLMPCGHDPNGKAAEGYQRGCILLARLGIAAFCYDPVAQGERVFYMTEAGVPTMGTTAEHTLFDVGAILTGTSIAQYRIWDGMRAIDYLQSRPDIKGDKIGVTGCSGGGTLSSYLMALDPRITAAAPSCYITSWKRLLETIGPQDGEQNIYGQLKHGMEHADYIHMRAPRPTLLMTATQDFFDIQGSWDSYREAKRIYTRLGVPERVALLEADEGHGYLKPHREGMAHWMQRWLLGVDQPVEEVPAGIMADAELQCTPRGQVLWMDGARSVIDLNRERAEGLKAGRAAFWQNTPAPDALNKVRELTGIRPDGTLPPTSAEVIAESDTATHHIQELLLTIEPGVVLPARSYMPKSGPATVAHLIAPGRDFEEVQPMVDAGLAANEAYLVVSVRDTGFTESHQWSGTWLNVGNDFSTFMRAYLNGLSFVGMRTEDLVQTAAWWNHTVGAPVALVAKGETTVPALHAAALHPDVFTHITLDGGIPTWKAVVETANAKDQLINTVHNALTYYDLDNLQSLLPAEKLAVTNAAVPVF
jgi:hypothetical protein